MNRRVIFFSSRRRHTRYWRDWSSDVCSSDLFEAGVPMTAQAIGLGAAVGYLERLGMDKVEEHEKAITAYALAKLADIQIGRASCRERVQISVVVVSLKKNIYLTLPHPPYVIP